MTFRFLALMILLINLINLSSVKGPPCELDNVVVVSLEKTDKSLLYEKVKSIKHPVEEDVDLYRKLFGQIYLQIRNNNYKFFSMIHDDWRERNWFGNWMIYTADILKLFLSYESGEEVSETELLETVGQLILDTEPFLGNPRACDLYALENFLLETYYLALAMAGSDNALEGVLNDLCLA